MRTRRSASRQGPPVRASGAVSCSTGLMVDRDPWHSPLQLTEEFAAPPLGAVASKSVHEDEPQKIDRAPDIPGANDYPRSLAEAARPLATASPDQNRRPDRGKAATCRHTAVARGAYHQLAARPPDERCARCSSRLERPTCPSIRLITPSKDQQVVDPLHDWPLLICRRMCLSAASRAHRSLC
jgi:hypothetical protein